jgi:hypothetical protein
MINPGGTWQQREAGPDGGGAEGCPIPLPLSGHHGRQAGQGCSSLHPVEWPHMSVFDIGLRG